MGCTSERRSSWSACSLASPLPTSRVNHIHMRKHTQTAMNAAQSSLPPDTERPCPAPGGTTRRSGASSGARLGGEVTLLQSTWYSMVLYNFLLDCVGLLSEQF